MKHLKRLTALALAAVMVFGSAVTTFAADGYSKLTKGWEYTIVGKGVEDDSIVMDLKLRAPEYIVKVEDTPHKSKAEIDVFYNETLEMYGIRIIAKEMLDTTFTLKYITRIDGVKQAYAYKYIPLTVIDQDRFLTSLDPESEEYAEKLEDLQDRDSVVNATEGLKSLKNPQPRCRKRTLWRCG